ncbi:MAG: Hpt domain-containing protein [Bacteroidales bacterium]
MKQLYSLKTINEMLDHDSQQVKEMVDLFIELAPETHQKMQQAYANKDLLTLQSQAHKLKSNLKLFDMDELAEAAKEIELHADDANSCKQVDQNMDKINDLLPKALDQMRKEQL